MAKKKKGKGRGWHGDSAGHAAAARKSGKGKKGKKSRSPVPKDPDKKLLYKVARAKGKSHTQAIKFSKGRHSSAELTAMHRAMAVRKFMRG